MAYKVIIDLSYFHAYYFDDPGLVPGTPPTGYALKPQVEQWIRDNGGCDGWGMVDVPLPFGTEELCLEITFSVRETAEKFQRQFGRIER